MPTEGNTGETNTTIKATVTALPNTTFKARRAIITITNGAGISIDVIVTQAGVVDDGV